MATEPMVTRKLLLLAILLAAAAWACFVLPKATGAELSAMWVAFLVATLLSTAMFPHLPLAMALLVAASMWLGSATYEVSWFLAMSGDFEPPMRSLQAQNTLRKMVIQLIIYAASGSLVGLPLKATLDRRYSWRVRALRVVAFTLVLGALYIGIIALLEKSLTIIN